MQVPESHQDVCRHNPAPRDRVLPARHHKAPEALEVVLGSRGDEERSLTRLVAGHQGEGVVGVELEDLAGLSLTDDLGNGGGGR